MLSRINEALLRLAARLQVEGGQGLTEYSLILAFVALASVLALTTLGLAIAGALGVVTGQI